MAGLRSAVAPREDAGSSRDRRGGDRIAASAPSRVDSWGLLVLPALVFLGIFFVLPMIGMVARSFTDPGPDNYLVFVESPLYLRVLVNTVRITLIATVASLILGYPYAYLMVHSGRTFAAILAGLVLLPFWSSILVRTYAWTVLLQDNGVVNSVLKQLDLIEQSVPLMRNTLGVTIGMTQILLPFMVFPIFAVMQRIDRDLVPAAQGLGASPWKAWLRVYAPLSMPGVLAGCLLVFVMALGFYITPALLGSPSDTMYSVIVANMVSQELRFGVASALSVILLVVTLTPLWLGTRVLRLGDILGVSLNRH